MKQPKKPYHHGNLKQALVTAGMAILEDEGIEGLSLRNCAARVGVSHTAPKNHFGNMTGLLTAVAASGYRILTANMRRGLDGQSTAEQRREAALRGYVDFAVENPHLFELMFSRSRINRDDPDLKEPVMACFEILREGARDRRHWDDGANAEARAQIMYWSLVHGYAHLAVSGRLNKESMKALDIMQIVPGELPTST